MPGAEDTVFALVKSNTEMHADGDNERITKCKTMHFKLDTLSRSAGVAVWTDHRDGGWAGVGIVPSGAKADVRIDSSKSRLLIRGCTDRELQRMAYLNTEMQTGWFFFITQMLKYFPFWLLPLLFGLEIFFLFTDLEKINIHLCVLLVKKMRNRYLNVHVVPF